MSQAKPPKATPELILASSSPYRTRLLERLRIPFRAVAPQADETPLDRESPRQLAVRLAQTKARALQSANPDAAVIGSDQVATLADRVLGKPGTEARARRMLLEASGQVLDFYTAVAVIHQDRCHQHLDHTRVRFRQLSQPAIDRYIIQDRPLDCAGAFKCEALGITLFDRIDSSDPTALVGLPLIQLAGILRRIGFLLP